MSDLSADREVHADVWSHTKAQVSSRKGVGSRKGAGFTSPRAKVHAKAQRKIRRKNIFQLESTAIKCRAFFIPVVC